MKVLFFIQYHQCLRMVIVFHGDVMTLKYLESPFGKIPSVLPIIQAPVFISEAIYKLPSIILLVYVLVKFMLTFFMGYSIYRELIFSDTLFKQNQHHSAQTKLTVAYGPFETRYPRGTISIIKLTRDK